MQPSKKIENINDIDINSNLVIEASAGTGKTYTIENLVVRILKSGKVRGLEDILIVTFTEKATGELKERIRENILKEINEGDDKSSAILQESLNSFDNASIYTIHGFCNSILYNYSFENGEPLTIELIDDSIVYKTILNRYLKDQWQGQYGEHLYPILKAAKFPGTMNSSFAKSWSDNIIDASIKYEPFGGDVINPVYDPDFISKMIEIEKAAKRIFEKISFLINFKDTISLEENKLSKDFDNLNINGRSKPKLKREIIFPLIDILNKNIKNEMSFADIVEFINISLRKEFDYSKLNSSWLKNKENYSEHIPNLPEMVSLLNDLTDLKINDIGHQFNSNVINSLKKKAEEYKRDNSYISYNDMLSLVSKSLEGEDNYLTEILQEKYRYGLVDEFQDTDLVQWNIFKKIFCESEKNRLFIIGDPKQAIYSFRGADIFAYYKAKEEMLDKYNAKLYSLSDNWRSTENLINSFNNLFSGRNWFKDNHIEYSANQFPENNKEKLSPYLQDSNNIVITDYGKCSAYEIKKKISNFISFEILNLLKQKDPAIKPGEIAILVRTKKESQLIESLLNEKGIPCSFYKKKGIFQSQEALELLYLLDGIANINSNSALKRTLCTNYFNFNLENLKTADEDTVKDLLLKWSYVAENSDWGKFFQSILEDSGIIQRILNETNSRRILSNIKQIIQFLQVEAFKQNFSLSEMISHLQNLKNSDSIIDEDFNLEKIETDEPGVQIMTIHASKGLEFKVVFIAGGYSSGRKSFFYRTSHIKENRLLDLTESNKEESKIESNEENRRLFYVAFTRASYKLYIPKYNMGRKDPDNFIASVMPESLELLKEDENVLFINFDEAEILTDHYSSIEKSYNKDEIDIDKISFNRSRFNNRKLFNESFSRLKSRAGETIVKMNSPIIHDEDINVIENIEKELPHGKHTGTMLHEILEEIDYSEVMNAEKYSLLIKPGTETEILIDNKIDHFYKNISNDERDLYKIECAKIIFNTLNTEIHNSFRLSGIKEKIHEMDFYFSMKNDTVSIPDIDLNSEGYINGSIDLVFRHKGLYYILDWKSNWLENGYGSESVRENVYHAKYDLQFQVYTLALSKYLANIYHDFTLKKYFGGIYYIYLRGMDLDDPQKGIFFYNPENEKELLDYESRIADAII